MLPLNITLLISGFLGFIVNWSLPTWELKYKEVIRNFAIVLVAFVITQFFITATPQKIWGQVIYVVLAIGFGFAPYTIYQIVTTKALDYFKKKADDIEEKK